MRQYRLAFVGAGRVADVHYGSIQAMSERARLVAVCDSRPQALVQRPGGVGGTRVRFLRAASSAKSTRTQCACSAYNVHLEL